MNTTPATPSRLPPAGRFSSSVASSCELLIGERGDALLGCDGIDAVLLEPTAHFFAGEHGVDAVAASLRGRWP